LQKTAIDAAKEAHASAQGDLDLSNKRFQNLQRESDSRFAACRDGYNDLLGALSSPADTTLNEIAADRHRMNDAQEKAALNRALSMK
jgi:hypothetical protein